MRGRRRLFAMLAELLKLDAQSAKIPELDVSYKPQRISPSFDGSVRDLLLAKIRSAWTRPQFATDVKVKNLSGGELQRAALVALGKSADIHLIDESSACLDSEQRVVAAKVIKRYVLHALKIASPSCSTISS